MIKYTHKLVQLFNSKTCRSVRSSCINVATHLQNAMVACVLQGHLDFQDHLTPLLHTEDSSVSSFSALVTTDERR